MKVKELRRYRAICAEIEYIESKIENKRIHVKDSVQSAAKHPYSKHNVVISGYIDDDYIPASTRKRLSELNKQRKQIEQTIHSISDYKVRRALEIYCLNSLDEDMKLPNWETVADIIADGSSGDSIRMSVQRYFEKNF
ncbi:MAG: hypothetical protein IJO29_01660 [Oscillospiraceae bacterium]|nr:hypothetical protein [Oscillospiraceae bacterium]